LYIAYVDDSGDESCDLLAGVLLPLDGWRDCLGAWLNWRRFLFSRWGIPADFELHAIEFLRPDRSPIPTSHSRAHKVIESGINDHVGQRHEVYRRSLEAIKYMPGVKVATVCRPGTNRVLTYKALLEAFQVTLEEADRDVLIMIDGGEPDPRLRIEHRLLDLGVRRVLEDPWPERSHHSQLLQIADLIVHAAFQHVIQNPKKRFMWDWYPRQLGEDIRFELSSGCACGIDRHP
jgi:hypothetical protein